jgi:argininosuccinate synthase
VSGKVILAYSGGLDTSVAIGWLKERYGMEVVTLTVDVGNEPDFSAIRQKALDAGAVKVVVREAKEEFVRRFVFPALQADAIYEGQYPLISALSRPLIAELLVETARAEGASAVAHGCTGKGNDQVRLKLYKGSSMVVGRKSPFSLYSYGLATYDKGGVFDHSASAGFIHIWGLPAKIQAQVQGTGGLEEG